MIGDWKAKAGGQDIARITGKIGLGVQNEVGQRLKEFCQENMLFTASTLLQHKRQVYTWTSPEGQYWDYIDYFLNAVAKDGDMHLKEAEDIKKRWQEYTEELYKKDLHDPDNHNGVITHLEPDILECEVSGP